MNDLISRQAAIDALADWKISPIVLEPVPSADVVEVVRCKDCLHYNAIDSDRLSECEKGFETYGNDFCSYGERAET